MEEKNNYFYVTVVAIIALVAVIGIVSMLGGNKNIAVPTENSVNGDLAGQAIKSVPLNTKVIEKENINEISVPIGFSLEYCEKNLAGFVKDNNCFIKSYESSYETFPLRITADECKKKSACSLNGDICTCFVLGGYDTHVAVEK